MSRSHLLAALFLILGTADLVLLNLWLMPAAWPPSSDPIATLTTPSESERTPEIEETSAQEHGAELVSQGGLLTESAEGTDPQQVAVAVSNWVDPAVEPREGLDRGVAPPGDEFLVEAPEAFEPQRVAPVALDLAGASMEPDREVESPMEPEGDELLVETPEAVEPQPIVAVVSDSADSAVTPAEETDSAAEQRTPISAAAVEPKLAWPDSETTGQPAAKLEYQTLLHAVVQFAFGGHTLSSAARDILDQTLRISREHPDTEIQVDGHTDSRGSEDYNYRLSERRARTIAALLEAEGIPPGRIQVRGHGPSQPLDLRNSAAARAKNRRVEITIRSRLP